MTLVTGIVLILAGVVWVLQGLDIAFTANSFMAGDTTWAIIGAGAIVTGGLLVWRALRRRG